ncbi:MAG: 7-cyano-7-deazaguanine synthase, partial [Candidatus Brockarchaeota archaeon]|nr:7-cyano-7-deazaguanine synthase [Candidatus Brockarchaeota archaeon]
MSLSQETQKKLQNLINWFKEAESVLVAFSGGVDSSVVAVVAKKAIGDKAVAVTADSPLLSPGELEEAISIAKNQGLRHIVIEVDELKNPKLVKNPPNRCYFCKKELMTTLKKVANDLNLKIVADGTNADDLKMHRPGFFALVE